VQASPAADASEVTVLSSDPTGGAGGTVTPGPVFLQGSGGLGGTAEARDFFGAALE
jgi:hypothetical protein